MVFSGGRTPGASGQTGAGPASQRRSLVRRGRRFAVARLQGRPTAIDRRQSVRRGSEQRTAGQPSLDGSRGGGGTRVSPRRNAGQPRESTSLPVLHPKEGVISTITLRCRDVSVGVSPQPLQIFSTRNRRWTRQDPPHLSFSSLSSSTNSALMTRFFVTRRNRSESV